jgi:hypothetical protein
MFSGEIGDYSFKRGINCEWYNDMFVTLSSQVQGVWAKYGWK